ncbi:MAG: hypothetical protein JW909_02130 [Planctomycetes bacterium]|nr:hypothetical protein [Planctomycetota bacterium]
MESSGKSGICSGTTGKRLKAAAGVLMAFNAVYVLAAWSKWGSVELLLGGDLSSPGQYAIWKAAAVLVMLTGSVMSFMALGQKPAMTWTAAATAMVAAVWMGIYRFAPGFHMLKGDFIQDGRVQRLGAWNIAEKAWDDLFNPGFGTCLLVCSIAAAALLVMAARRDKRQREESQPE